MRPGGPPLTIAQTRRTQWLASETKGSNKALTGAVLREQSIASSTGRPKTANATGHCAVIAPCQSGLTDGDGNGRAERDPGIVDRQSEASKTEQAVLALELVAVTSGIEDNTVLDVGHNLLLGALDGGHVAGLFLADHGFSHFDLCVRARLGGRVEFVAGVASVEDIGRLMMQDLYCPAHLARDGTKQSQEERSSKPPRLVRRALCFKNTASVAPAPMLPR